MICFLDLPFEHLSKIVWCPSGMKVMVSLLIVDTCPQILIGFSVAESIELTDWV